MGEELTIPDRRKHVALMYQIAQYRETLLTIRLVADEAAKLIDYNAKLERLIDITRICDEALARQELITL